MALLPASKQTSLPCLPSKPALYLNLLAVLPLPPLRLLLPPPPLPLLLMLLRLLPPPVRLLLA